MGEQHSGKLMRREQVVRPSVCCNCMMHCLDTTDKSSASFETAFLTQSCPVEGHAAVPHMPFRAGPLNVAVQSSWRP